MGNALKKFFRELLWLAMLGAFFYGNWRWPLYDFLGDSPLIRFVWLGIFFLLLNFSIDIFERLIKDFRLIGGDIGLDRNLKKLPREFAVLKRIKLSYGISLDYVVVGPSVIWIFIVEDQEGKVVFDGDELSQDGKILKGLITRALEKLYTLREFLKNHLKRDFGVAPLVIFSNPRADIESVPQVIRGTYVASARTVISLVRDFKGETIDEETRAILIKILKKQHG